MSDVTNSNLSATTSIKGSFLNPKTWSEEGKKNDIYIYYIDDKEIYFGLKTDGKPSDHNWYFPTTVTDNSHFFFAGFHSGTNADPKVWDEYGKVGSVYYEETHGFYRLKVEGYPVTANRGIPKKGESNDKWEFMGERAGTFINPKSWSDEGSVGDIYVTFTYNRDYYYKLKQAGKPSSHYWHYPDPGQSDDIWTFAGYNPGTKERPKSWSEYGEKGCYYSDYSGFFKLKAEGIPSEHIWYYPTDNKSNNIWEVHGVRLGTKRFPKDFTDNGSTGDIYIGFYKNYTYRLTDTGSPKNSNWLFPDDPNQAPAPAPDPDPDPDITVRYDDTTSVIPATESHWDSELIAYNHEKPAKWMSYFRDDTPLNQISIPGTHDSSTFAADGASVVRGLVMTQNAIDDISKQLTDGIRFIDARCRHIENSFAMHHDRYYLNHMFGDVLNACYSFLAANPSECIIMSVKQEYDESKCTRTFIETFEQSYYNKDRWYVGNTVPRLGDVRGKIVLLSRFGGNMGILANGWKDNDVSQLGGYLYIQDKYNEHNEVNKWHAIKEAWDFSANNHKLGWLTLNFTSISGEAGTTPYEYAADKNPELANYISSRKEGGGIIISDYYYEGRIAQNVIKTNFRDI